MTERQMLDTLINCGERMRSAQKGFFSTKDKSIRQNFLIKSKQYEKEFDTALFNIKQFLQ